MTVRYTEAEAFAIQNRRTFMPQPHPPSPQPAERESKLHEAIIKYCEARGWLYRRDRMDKPTTGQIGFPDFVIFMDGGKAAFVECKKKGKKATIDQLCKLAHARRLGFPAGVAENMQEFLEIVKI
jgi:hypothetical protein